MPDTEKGFLEIADPDAPIYRIYKVPHFLEALERKELVLVHPEIWDDPYEKLPSLVALEPTTLEGKVLRQIMTDQYLRPAYAQAWSWTHASDTLLRAYSIVKKDSAGLNSLPEEEGVRVTSTPRKLLEAMKTWCPTNPDKDCSIGTVRYLDEDQIKQVLVNGLNDLYQNRRLAALSESLIRAKLLLLKRGEYAHEAEVRLTYVEQRELDSYESLLRVPCNPNAIFEEVVFDPRLTEFERRKREERAMELGYKNTVKRSPFYQGLLLQVPVPALEHEEKP